MINLLTGGISQFSLRAVALSIQAASLDVFLDKMRRITDGMGDLTKKTAPSVAPVKIKTSECRNCGKRGHTHRECRNDLSCFYCKGKGHRQYDCPNKRTRESAVQSHHPPRTAVRSAANVSAEPPSPEPTTDIVAVAEQPGSLLSTNTA